MRPPNTDITICEIRHFLELAKKLHFGKAAKKLSIKQPSLSSSIKKLEGKLGLKLFIRNQPGVRLTSAGRKLIFPAKNMFTYFNALKDLAKFESASAKRKK